jgi:hypothetical protein
VPIEERKHALARLIGRAKPPGLLLNVTYEAPGLGCEGIVSKRIDFNGKAP